MADIVDLAQEREEAHREASLARFRARSAEPAAPPEARDCVRCGDPIPPARLALVPNARTCTDCQELQERRGAR